MKRIAAFVYGVACYGVFFGTFLYAIGFLGNFGVPKSIDSGKEGPMLTALLVNGALLALFALQHSIMARPWFKRAWTRLVPVPLERSTYVLLSSLALMLMFWLWQPIGGVIWDLRGGVAETVMLAFYATGLIIVLLSTFLINHFDLFGLRQVYLYLIGEPYTHLEFRTPFFYRFVRHPLLRRLVTHLLVGAGHDRGSLVLRPDYHGVHSGGDSIRGGGSHRRSRREVSALSRAGADDCAGCPLQYRIRFVAA
jgi:protein-S-isoprenylcysteine O-methyltransferase Ste14